LSKVKENTVNSHQNTHLSGVLDVVKHVLASSRLLTPGLDDDARAADDLDGLAFGVVLAEASPLAEELSVLDLGQGDGVLVAKGGDELGVSGLVARVSQHAEVGLSAVESLHSLVEATGKTIVEQRSAEHLLEGRGGVKGSFLLNLRLFGLDFNFDINFGFFFSHLCLCPHWLQLKKLK